MTWRPTRPWGQVAERGRRRSTWFPIAINCTTIAAMDQQEVAAALRQISRGFEALARAIGDDHSADDPEHRYLAVLREWGDRGLTRERAIALLSRHGFAPQSVGGWTRGDWIETRDDGLRYLTSRSLSWLAEQDANRPDEQHQQHEEDDDA